LPKYFILLITDYNVFCWNYNLLIYS